MLKTSKVSYTKVPNTHYLNEQLSHDSQKGPPDYEQDDASHYIQLQRPPLLQAGKIAM